MAAIALAFALLLAQAPTTPAGWKRTELAGGGVEVVPRDLKAGETFRVAVYPPKPLGDATIQDWIVARIAEDGALGKAQGEAKLQSQSANGALFIQPFVTKGGETVYALYTAFANGGKAKMMRIVLSAQEGLYARYTDALAPMIKGLNESAALIETKGGTVASDPVYARLLPKVFADYRIGGTLKTGIYEGKRIYEGKNGSTTETRLSLYPNGEYRILFKGEDDKDFHLPNLGGEGEYGYKEPKGTLEIGNGFNLNNNRSDPADEHCLLLTDPEGRPWIYARDDRGFNYLRTLLVYKGPVDSPSPTLAKQVRAEREAAAKRFKWITAAHKGLQPAQIHSIRHRQKSIVSGMGGAVAQNDVYILLKDGSIYDGMPVAPDMFDAPTSRRKEPEKWGVWKASGGKILVAWKDSNGRFEPLDADPVKPATATTRLTGRYGTGSSSSTIGFSSWAIWGVTFKGDRFVKDRRGGAGNYNSIPTPGSVSINTVYDDDSSSTSAIGDGIVVASNNKADGRRTRTGSYAFDGYTLVLKYDDGRVIRHPFFLSPSGKGIWFEGNYLTTDN